MTLDSLAAFVEALDRAGELVRVRHPVSVDLELCEIADRAMKQPGGRFVILEFSTPRSAVVRAGYHAYFHHVLPFVGQVVSGHGSAYRYLPRSVANFPSERALAARMERVGYTGVTWRTLTLGVAALHVGVKA